MLTKNRVIQIASLLTFSLLAGCTAVTLTSENVDPESLGISQQQWNTYSEAKRADIIDGANSVYGPLSLPNDTPESSLLVKIAGGKVMMPPFTKHYRYQPVTFTLSNDTCETVKLTQRSGSKTINMEACYVNNALYLDPSPYRVAKQYGIRLPALPVWKRGFTYRNISSQGYVRLHNADVTIKRKMDRGESF